MPEYTATCAIQPTDTMTAGRQGDYVRLQGNQVGSYRMAAIVPPTDARTFARGILALADAIDGGEAKPVADEPLKVGDRVVVVKDDPSSREGEFVGRVGRLTSYSGSGRLPYEVTFGTGDGYHGDKVNGAWWCAEVRRDDEPTTVAPEPTPQAVKVGDKVRIVREYSNHGGSYDGATGLLLSVDLDDTDFPYEVDVPGYGSCASHEVVLIDEPTTPDEPASVADPRRMALLKEAQQLVDDAEYASDIDVLSLARFLAGE